MFKRTAAASLGMILMLGAGAATASGKREVDPFSKNALLEKDWEAAANHLKAQVFKNDQNEAAFYCLGVAYYHLGDVNAAMAAEKRAIELDPDYLEAYLELAAICSGTGDMSGAEQYLLQARTRFPDSVDVQKSLLTIKKNKDNQAAPASVPRTPIKTAKATIDTGLSMFSAADVPKAMERAGQEFQAGRLKEALKYAGVASRYAPNDPEVFKTAYKIYVAQGNLNLAQQAAQSLVKLDPNSVENRNMLAWVHSRKGQWHEAFDEYTNSFSMDNGNLEAIVGKQMSLAGMGELKAARWNLKTQVSLHPNDVWPLLGLGQVYQMENRYDKAYQCISRAAALEPGNLKVAQSLGDLYARMGVALKKPAYFKKAAAQYDFVLGHAPYSSDASAALGMSLNKMGQKDKAEETVQRTLIESPGSDTARGAQKHLEKENKDRPAKKSSSVADQNSGM